MPCPERCGVLFAVACFLVVFYYVEASRILVIVPTALYSHQVGFQPFTQELARRGHHVVVLTTDPAFPPDQAPQNLTEVDLHELSYRLRSQMFQNIRHERVSDFNKQMKRGYETLIEIYAKQMQTEQVRRMLSDKNQQFDLVITEASVFPALALAHIYRTPAILMSTYGMKDETYEIAGVPIHPILYPDTYQTSRYNLSMWEQARMFYKRAQYHFILEMMDEKQEIVIREMYNGEVPSLQELKKKVELQFVNLHPLWEGYRPMTLNVVHLGGIHLTPPKDLPEDLKMLMDSSKRGVIYMSFGSHVNPSLLPSDRMAVFAQVFATLPYDVVWKLKDAPQDVPSNVRTFSWLPQADLLRHEKVLLFITQGGLQSTDEALRAGVPLLGIPLLSDQWVNVENYERLGVGLRLDLFTLTKIQLKEAIEKLINDKSYRERSAQLVRLMHDQPQSSLDRAVWWTERVVRLRGRHMTTPPPPLTWDGLLQALIISFLLGPVILIFVTISFCKLLKNLILKILTICRCYYARRFSRRVEIFRC